MDYTELIAELRSAFIDIELSAPKANKIASAIEALQARVTASEQVIALQVENYAELSEQNDARHGYFNFVMQERDILQARMKELESDLADRTKLHHGCIDDLKDALAKLEALEKQAPVDAVALEDMVDGSHPSYGGGLFTTHNCVKQMFTRPVPAKTLTDAEIDALWVDEKLTLPQITVRRKIARAIEAALKGGASPVPAKALSDSEIMDATRNLCREFRWPSTAIDIARAIEQALKGGA